MFHFDRHTWLAVKIVAASWLAVGICLLSPLIVPRWDLVTPNFVVYVAVSFLIFYLAFLLGQSLSVPVQVPAKFASARMAMFLFFFAAVVCRAADQLVLRPIGNPLSVASVRAAREASSNPFSVVGAVAPAFAIVLYTVLRERLGRHDRILATVAIWAIIIDIYFSGSRGSILVILILLFGHKLNRKRILIGVALLIPLSGLLYLARFSSLTGSSNSITDVMYANSTTGYAVFVPVAAEHIGLIFGSYGRILGFPLIQINQYVAHSLFEFASYYGNLPSYSWAPGSFIPQVPGVSVQSSFYYPANVYYTLPGTLSIAFGQAGAVFGAVVGGVMGVVYRRSLALSSSAQALVLLALGGAAVVNTIGGYDIVFYLAAIWIVSRYKVYDADEETGTRGMAKLVTGYSRQSGASDRRAGASVTARTRSGGRIHGHRARWDK